MTTGNPALLRSSASWHLGGPPPVVTIGNFDGVHLGHQALLRQARRLAGVGSPVVALSFDPLPRDVLRPDHGIPLLQPPAVRAEALVAHGADHVVLDAFNHDYAALRPADFAAQVLRGRLGARAVVVGFDFRFGRGREGTAAGLRELLGLPVVEVEAVMLGGAPVSSTRVRARVGEGRVAEASALLGRVYQVRGEVVPGDARGRQLGFPTANLARGGGLWPADGVYAVRAGQGSDGWQGIANIGPQPTFRGAERRLEVHLLDAAPDLYGRTVVVDFVARLRDVRRFDGAAALITQIRADIAAARAVMAG